MTNKPPSTAIIISTYNNIEGLESIFLALCIQSQKPHTIYIADDGSANETARLISKYAQKLPLKHYWQEDEGYRKARALNNALQAVTEEYIIFLDGDTVPHKQLVEDHKKLAKQGYALFGTRAGIEGYTDKVFSSPPSLIWLLAHFFKGQIINDSRRFSTNLTQRIRGLLKAVRLFKPKLKSAKPTDIRGGNYSAWTQDLVDINGFDARFEGWGHEDVDTARRLELKGCKFQQAFFHAVSYHLCHPERSENLDNLALISNTVEMRCTEGLNLARDFQGQSTAKNN